MKGIPNTHNIRKSGSNYRIDKDVDGKKYNFGTYSTLDEAITYRNYFEEKGWDNCLNERLDYTNKPKYITGNENRGFEVRKVIGGELVHFGRFHSLEAAEDEVEQCKKAEWDWDLLCELDETNGNPEYLPKKLWNAGVYK